MTDLDRRCLKKERDLERKIERLDQILSKTRGWTSRFVRLKKARDEWIIELHDMRKAHLAFDRAFQAALDDPTGQMLDDFPYDDDRPERYGF